MDEEKIFVNRIAELAERAYSRGVLQFSDFLGLNEQSIYHRMEAEVSWAGVTVFGGHAQCERVMLGFGSAEIPTTDFPLVCIKASPTAPKFADALTHRDILGALMNLGIERDKLGDIFIAENCAYFFCVASLAEPICAGLTKAKHTELRCVITDFLPEEAASRTETCMVQVASPRLDALVAAVYRLSREKSQELFRQGKIYVNGSLCENNSELAKDGAVISVRSFGRFRFCGSVSTSRKGKLNVQIEKYIS